MFKRDFTEEQQMFREAYRKFLHQEIVPKMETWREQGIVDREAFLKAGEDGFLMVWPDEEYGGLGDTDFRFEQIIIEENQYALTSDWYCTLHSRLVGTYDDVVERFGALHIVNNYAGIGSACKTYGKDGPHPLDVYQKVVAINQVGTFNVCRLAAEKMAANEPEGDDAIRGVIINTASVAAYEGQIGQVAYSATKGAVVGMTLPMARELAYYGIRVNTIVPGLIHTPLFDAIEDSYYRSLEASTVYPKRLGKTSEIAALSAHIVGNDYINGECIRIDAGIRMQPK